MSMRTFFFLASLICVLFGPWWGALIGAVLVSMRYRAYEMVLLGIIADVLWLSHDILWGIPVITGATIFIMWFFEPLRRELFVSLR